MKNLILFCVFTLSINLFSQIPTNGLVAYYPFNGNANDESGNGNHGTQINGVNWTKDRFNNNESAINFDGYSGYVLVPNSSSIQSPSTEITFSTWISIQNWYEPIGIAPILNKGDTEYWFYLYRQGLIFKLSGVGYFDVPYYFEFNRWYHLAATWDGITVKVYIDNIVVYTSSASGIIFTSNTDLEFGRDTPGETEYLVGKLDDLLIYNTALTEAEISNIYHENNWPIIPSPVALYPFNGNYSDFSGNNLHLTSQGSPTLTLDRFEKPDSAYYFDGINDFFIHNYDTILSPSNSLTVNAWIKNSGVDGESDVVVSTLDFPDIGGYQIDLSWLDGQEVISWDIRPYSDQKVIHIPYESQWKNQWIMITGTFDQNSMKIYINGELKGSLNTGATIYYESTNNFRIGANPHSEGPDRRFKGSIDDVIVFNSVLNESQIQVIYNNSLPTWNKIVNVEIYTPNSLDLNQNYFYDEILLEENRIILSPFISALAVPKWSLTNIKISAYLNNIPMNIKLNSINRILDENNDGLIDSLKTDINGILGARFLIYSDLLEQNLVNATIKIVIEKASGIQYNQNEVRTVSYYFPKTDQYNGFLRNRDSYKFNNLSKLSWNEFLTFTFDQIGIPSINLLTTLFTEVMVWNGRCWGMSATAGKYYYYPEDKPYVNDVYNWEETDINVTSQITVAQLNQAIFLFNFIFPPNNQTGYENLRNYLVNNQLAIISLRETGEEGGHAILATSLTEIGEKSFIRVYDSNYPYNPQGAGIYYIDYNTNTNHYSTANLYTYDRIDAFSDFVFNMSTEQITWSNLFNKLLSVLNLNNKKQFSVGCPINLIIKNSANMRFGFDENGQLVNEILGCSFSKVPTFEGSEDSITIIYAPDSENYTVLLNAYGQGELLFSLNKAESINKIYTVYADSVAITSSSIGAFDENDLNNNLLLDYDGDGVVDTVIALTANLITSTIKSTNFPIEFYLFQNYPNPFNPSTKINWQSPLAGHQTLKVYDVLGNEVATLVNEFRNAGSYDVNFDASKLSSGVYFYQLRIGDFIQTKKMLLLK